MDGAELKFELTPSRITMLAEMFVYPFDEVYVPPWDREGGPDAPGSKFYDPRGTDVTADVEDLIRAGWVTFGKAFGRPIACLTLAGEDVLRSLGKLPGQRRR